MQNWCSPATTFLAISRTGIFTSLSKAGRTLSKGVEPTDACAQHLNADKLWPPAFMLLKSFSVYYTGRSWSEGAVLIIFSVWNRLQLHTVNTTTSFLATRCMQYKTTAIIPYSRGTQTVKHGKYYQIPNKNQSNIFHQSRRKGVCMHSDAWAVLT